MQHSLHDLTLTFPGLIAPASTTYFFLFLIFTPWKIYKGQGVLSFCPGLTRLNMPNSFSFLWYGSLSRSLVLRSSYLHLAHPEFFLLELKLLYRTPYISYMYILLHLYLLEKMDSYSSNTYPYHFANSIHQWPNRIQFSLRGKAKYSSRRINRSAASVLWKKLVNAAEVWPRHVLVHFNNSLSCSDAVLSYSLPMYSRLHFSWHVFCISTTAVFMLFLYDVSETLSYRCLTGFWANSWFMCPCH